jgi:uncharacterized protein with PQ loop repeat
MLEVFSWIAVVLLCSSYWLQVWKIHIHKEVRDLSLPMFIVMDIALIILTVWSVYIESWVFIWKQVLCIIPVSMIIFQIFYHKQDKWHDDYDPSCAKCLKECEPDWIHCPYCGEGRAT